MITAAGEVYSSPATGMYFLTTDAMALPSNGGTEFPICIYVFVYAPRKK